MNLIDPDLMVRSIPFLLKGAGYTVELSLGGMIFGLAFGFVIALMRLSRRKLMRGMARVYVSFIRGTPLLVQLFVIYYGLAQFGLRLDPIPSALIGLSLNVRAIPAKSCAPPSPRSTRANGRRPRRWACPGRPPCAW